MLTTEDRMNIARTIKSQIGIRTLMACGARDFVCGMNGDLSFKVGSSRGRIKMIHIILEPSDTYTVIYKEKYNSGPKKYEDAYHKSVDDVYCDMLADIVYGMVNS